MWVVATAGHVDHGKSALVRAVTGMEPDRWQAERDRGLTIDLGFVWTDLPGGQSVAFVDVPGHQRFIGNMVAGIGPCPAVIFVVSADEGWSRQSSEHLAALDGLGVSHRLLVVTKSDLADPAPVLADARRRLLRSGVARDVAAVAVSARTGAGLPDFLAALQRMLAAMPVPDPAAPVRLWVDRSFSMRGAGTVVTGTLAAGRIAVGDELLWRRRRLRVRGLQSLDVGQQTVTGPARVAINLADVAVAEIGRGDVLVSPGRWWSSSTVDVRLDPAVAPDAVPGSPPGERPGEPLPGEATLHLGTLAMPVRIRSLADDIARLILPQPVPLALGDRAILRSPGKQQILGGVQVLDFDPPPLRRRGAARVWATRLQQSAGRFDLISQVGRRGVLARADARLLGAPEHADPPQGTVLLTGRFVDADLWQHWITALRAALDTQAQRDPLQPSISRDAVAGILAATPAVGLRAELLGADSNPPPPRELLGDLIAAAGLAEAGGRVGRPGVVADLGLAEAGLVDIERRLTENPWAAPDREDLQEAGLGPRELAAAARSGRILRLPGDIVLRPDAPARAMRVLAALPQPFTLSQAREALGSTRRVVVPLLEHLDHRSWTTRVDAQHRKVTIGSRRVLPALRSAHPGPAPPPGGPPAGPPAGPQAGPPAGTAGAVR